MLLHAGSDEKNKRKDDKKRSKKREDKKTKGGVYRSTYPF
jgi:hypothetical protein